MEVKEAGKIRGEFTFQTAGVRNAEAGGPVSVGYLLSQKGSRCIRPAARGSKGGGKIFRLPGPRRLYAEGMSCKEQESSDRLSLEVGV